MAAFFNLTGALMGTAVASTLGKGIVDLKVVTMPTILCALLSAIVWNLITWLLGFAVELESRADRWPLRSGFGDRRR
jgi:phosphate/sulfate permease